MANPQNPLDKYKSYTYHFELHAATTWDVLKNDTEPSEAATTPYEATGTLLINTRKDAHQTIDNVRFAYHDPRVDPTGTTASVLQLTMTITEPNGTFFIQKIEKMMTDMQVSNINTGCTFMLKIIFVGRNEDNSIEVDEIEVVRIPLQLIDINAEFTYKGGTYGLVFSGSGAGTMVNNNYYHELNQIANNDGYSHKNISVKGRTVREAIDSLQSGLQKNYDESRKNQATEGRTIRYEVNLDEKLNGNLNLVTKDTWSPDDYMKVTFDPKTPIIDMIRKIMMSSKEVNDMISQSAEGLRGEFEPNVRYPTYSTRYYLTDTEAVIAYDIILYEGEIADTFEFDFLFAQPPGKNVDVISFEMKYTSLLGWLQWSLMNSLSFHSNQDNEVATADPQHYRDNVVIKNTKSQRYINQSPATVQYSLGLQAMDVHSSPGTNENEDAGQAHLTHVGAQAARLAFNTVAEMHGSRHPQLTFLIRGHHDLLFHCIPTPDGRNVGFGHRDAIWIKVNIKNQDGMEFFYTGYYRLFTVENIFENGQFTQQLTVIMMDRVTTLGGNAGSVTPQSNNNQTSGEDTRGESSANLNLTSNTDALGNIIN